MTTTKVILDCDPGHDDAVAIVMAGRSPELDIIGITCVAGNVSVEHTTRNALRICTLAEMPKIPVCKGMTRPLLGENRTAVDVHGITGLDGADLPEPDREPHPIHAVDFLIETLMTSNGDITVIPTGPLTNIAMALLREPRLVRKIPQIVMMGGTMGIGNITPSAEFNIYADPEAAKVVFESGILITMLGLDVTHQVILTHNHIVRLRAANTRLTSTFADLLTFHLHALAKLGDTEGAAMHDPCAVMAVCEPSMLRTQFMHVDIETTGKFTRGRTVCDVRNRLGKTPNVHVGISINADRFFEHFFERVR